MKAEEKALIKAKKVEFILGLFFLIPAIIYVVVILYSIFIELKEGSPITFWGYYNDNDIYSGYTPDQLDFLSLAGFLNFDGNGPIKSLPTSLPIYMGLISMVGVYLIKNSLMYIFIDLEKKDETQSEVK